MARPLKLSAYPTAFWTLSRKALDNKSSFPIHLTFPTPQEAQAYRVSFYEFRRALKASVEASSKGSYSLNPEESIALEGASLITSPRIDYSSSPCTMTFTLQEKRTSMAIGNAQLEAALAVASGKSKAQALAQEQGLAQAQEQELSISIPFKNALYIIPLSDIPESKQSLSGTKLLTLVTAGLADLKHPLSFYKQEPSLTDGIGLSDKTRI